MPSYQTPGVYRLPRQAEDRDVRLVRTDVAGFAGFAERGPIAPQQVELKGPVEQFAIKLTAWDEYRAIFGGFVPYGYLGYAVRAFFENGGRTCYVVRVATTSDATRTASFAFPGSVDGGPAPRTGDPTFSSSLTAAAPAGHTQLAIDPQGALRTTDGTNPSPVDLFEIAGSGVREFHVGAITGNAIVLGAPLRANYSAGDTIRGYAAVLKVEARSPGDWGNRIRLGVLPLTPGKVATSFALRVRVDPGPDNSWPKEEEFFRQLSLDPTDPFYAPNIINARSRIIRVTSPAELPRDEPPPRSAAVGSLAITSGPLADGLVRLENGRDVVSGVTARDFTGAGDDFRGLRLLEAVEQVSILCAPDAVLEDIPPLVEPPQVPNAPCAPPRPEDELAAGAATWTAVMPSLTEEAAQQVFVAMIDQCERLRDRVAIIDAPRKRSTGSLVTEWRNRFDSKFGALYYPWLRVPDPLQAAGSVREVPPSGHVAGVYAQVDTAFGVHRPPANVALEGVIDVVEMVTSLEQEHLNPVSVNVLRSFPGRGIRVWGARSLDRQDSRWRFIHARRLLSMIEESTYHSTQWAVFEPNDENLRRTLTHSLSVFLRAIWQQGGLEGTSPQEAYFVKCDDTNNPPTVVNAGQIVCQVGVAIAAPMEFLVFDLRQTPTGPVFAEA
jgi:hypothetical protein